MNTYMSYVNIYVSKNNRMRSSLRTPNDDDVAVTKKSIWIIYYDAEKWLYDDDDHKQAAQTE